MTTTHGGEERLCRLHSPDLGMHELRPGESIRLGRHVDNDIVLAHPRVSRFHARITWDPEMERPVLFDNGSQNGTIVDGDRVHQTEPLRSLAKIEIGPFEMQVELLGIGETPALLYDTGELVTLFSERGPDLGGQLSENLTILSLMQRLETERRTGTLSLKEDGPWKVTYCLGRIMRIDPPHPMANMLALDCFLCLKTGTFEFTRDLEPIENSMNIWVSDFLRQRRSKDQAAETLHPDM